MALDMTTALTIRAQVTGQQQITGLSNGLKSVAGASNASATAMGRLKTAATGAFGLVRQFLPVFSSIAAIGFAKNQIDAADAMSKLSQRTGVAAPMLDKFRKVAELNDTSIESLGKGFTALASNAADAANGTGPAAEAFRQLGVNLTDSSGKLLGVDQIMLQVADRFAQMEGGTKKADLANDLFGRRLGSELIPLLNQGGDAVREMSTSMTQEFADDAATLNDRLTNITESLNRFGLVATETLLPVLDSLASVLEKVSNAFDLLPEPLQKITASVIALAAAWALLAPIITSLVGLLKGLAALKIGATIAGWAGAIGPLVAALKGLGAILLAALGPVGWVALIAGAGAALYVFRDQVAEVMDFIGKRMGDAAKLVYRVFVDPIVKSGDVIIRGFRAAFSGLAKAATAPFERAVDLIKSIFRGLLKFVANGINKATGSINTLIRGYNSIPNLPDIPTIPQVRVPAFAAGGVVNGPTLAMVGEGGQSEYIIPESKMAKAAANYLSGMRGRSVIPAFAEGGVVGPMGGGGAANTTVQITTGPVLQQDGQRYVTVGDLERALQDFGSQVFRNSRSYGGRRYQGAY